MNAVRSGKLMVQVLFLLLLTDLAFSEANNRTPARILAKQTGAAQFEEHIEQPIHYDCNEHHHRLRKRSSDEDLDYEVYQGVVGRPGIDFPIFPRIPQTTFSCRSFGNGYFADLETGCQVFHICEEGRKISFLCPNGTIFQQSELTCDWWFKVNCAGSPSFYVESAEILNKARRQRVKTTPVHKGFSNNNKVAEIIPVGKTYKGSERRIDSNENPSVESLDFEDISDDRSADKSNERSNDRSNVRTSDRSKNRSYDRSNVGKNDRSNDRSTNRSSDKLKIQKEKLLTNPPPDDHPHHHHNEHELQITAETSSFVKDPRKNSYTGTEKTLNKEREFISDKPSDKGRDILPPRVQSVVRSNQRNDFNEKQKTGKKIGDDKPAGFYITSRPDISPPSTAGKGSYYTTAQPELFTNRNSLEDLTVSDKQFVTPESEDKTSHGTYSTIKPDFFGNGPIVKSATTPSSYPGTYSTARRLDTTRTTPFYTPTVPSIVRTKPTESKKFFVNVVKSEDEPTTLRGAVTVDNVTPKSVIIGMRRDDSEIHRFPIFSNGDLKVQLPVYAVEPPRPAGVSLTTSTSGPTYLPKVTEGNKNFPVTPPNIDSSVSRNIKGILQTVGMIKETMKANFDGPKNISTRFGLDIPPSSGPGTLLSLTNYFANDEQVVPTVSSEEDKETTPVVDISAVLLSNKTSGKYFSLFGLNQNDTDQADEIPLATTAAPTIVYPPTSIGDFTRTTIRDLAQNPETRKIAQVFSNAITKYIENPETFRKDLIDARPTQPPPRKSVSVTELPTTTEAYTTPSNFFNKGGTVTVSILTDTTLSSAVKKGATQSYPTTTERYEATTNPTTESNDIAKEINNQFDVSTQAYDSVSTESTEATTYRGSAFSTSRPKPSLDTNISSGLLPPSTDEEHEHESLHKVQSQSFVKSFNDLAKAPKSISFDKNKNTLDTSAEKVTTLGGRGSISFDKNKNTLDTSAEKVTTLGGPKVKGARTEGPLTHSTITQTEGDSRFDTTTDKALTTTISQKDKATERPITETKNRLETSTDKVTSTGRSQDLAPFTYPSRNKFDTTSDTLTTTGRSQDQKGKSTDYPWTHTTITQPSAKSIFDSSAEKVTTSRNPWLQNQKTNVKPTENPWSQITQSIYLDPLTINDGLMREPKTTTDRPFAFVNTDRSRFEDTSEGDDDIDDILNSPELSSELLPKNNGLQRIANKLFGGLNETEAEHLKNVMKKAEHNRNVLQLLLLLIQTCDDQNGKALERSRKILLNALIGMDSKLKSKNPSQVSATTTNKIPVTTYRRNFSDGATTARSPATTESSSSEETTKFEILVPDPEDEEDNILNTSTVKAASSSEQQSRSFDNPNRTSDERALELLKSLYSLASKFSRR